MSKRDKVFIALGGLLGAGIYLFFEFWLNYWLHIEYAALPRLMMGLLLSAALGCMAGLATRPFADDGLSLVRNSVLHYLGTALLFAGLILTMGGNALACGIWTLILSALYLGIWLARWIGWYMEIMQIRELLGLSPGHSPLKWRETLPYLPYVLLLCDGLPLAAFLIDKVGHPRPVRHRGPLSAAARHRICLRRVPRQAAGGVSALPGGLFPVLSAHGIYPLQLLSHVPLLHGGRPRPDGQCTGMAVPPCGAENEISNLTSLSVGEGLAPPESDLR